MAAAAAVVVVTGNWLVQSAQEDEQDDRDECTQMGPLETLS